MYNSKGPTGKKSFMKASSGNIKKDHDSDKKRGIKQGSAKDKKLDKAKFGKEV